MSSRVRHEVPPCHVDRRVLLGGLAAAALPRRGLARLSIEPPDRGLLSAAAVGGLLAQYKVPGASLAIVDKGELTATYCYGLAQPTKPVVAATCFGARSISKTINARAILRLVARGRMGLDDPVNNHLIEGSFPPMR